MLVPTAIKTLLSAALMAAAAGTSQATSDVTAGSAWTQADAERICPVLAKQYQLRRTGQWHTTVQDDMAVCQVSFL